MVHVGRRMCNVAVVRTLLGACACALPSAESMVVLSLASHCPSS